MQNSSTPAHQSMGWTSMLNDLTVNFLVNRSAVFNLFLRLSATCWPRASPAEPIPGSHEPPVQHPRGPESGQPAAGEEPAAPKPDTCSDTLPPTGLAEDQLQPRVSDDGLVQIACVYILFCLIMSSSFKTDTAMLCLHFQFFRLSAVNNCLRTKLHTIKWDFFHFKLLLTVKSQILAVV